jgi:catalytic LigB subunit of aromatic ring-opening dioxygenase
LRACFSARAEFITGRNHRAKRVDLMAKIAMGIGTSHGPLLNTPPEEWGQRAAADRRSRELIYQGVGYTFEQLREARGRDFSDECAMDVWVRRYTAARAAIDELGRRIVEADLDALVVVSSDHKETFGDELLAQFAFYWGDSVQHEPYTEQQLAQLPEGLAIAEVANQPSVSTTRKTHADLALHLLRETSAAGFDPAASRKLPAGRWENAGIPHGWGFVYQQVLGGAYEIPVVPLFVNTFWEPNPPSAARCYDFGIALGNAVASYPENLRVGVVASGGLSHMVVDEELDRQFLDALLSDDRGFLASLRADVLRSGTSEMRSWIVAGTAANRAGLIGTLVDYQPCYRSEAGTGCAMGFVSWEQA